MRISVVAPLQGRLILVGRNSLKVEILDRTQILQRIITGSSNGRTLVFEANYLGSNPGPVACRELV